MNDRRILAIDQGTTNTKALLVDPSGTVAARASRPIGVTFPEPGWVEQDPRALWSSVLEAVDELMLNCRPQALAAIGVTNQRESVMLWERQTGHPVGPCVVWQCRRTAPFCDSLRRDRLGPLLESRTGLTIDPLFSASKARWLLDHAPAGQTRAEAGDLCLGTVDSWILWNLTGGSVHATDMSNASRTQLFDISALRWDPELLAIFGIPLASLPQVQPSSGIFGVSVAQRHLPAGVPIASLIGDSHAALFGHAGFDPGTVKATYGTGSSLMTVTPVPVRSAGGLSTTIAWARAGSVTYALEGNIAVTGAALQWLGELLGLRDPAGDVASLAATAEDAGGVYLVPAFAGLGAPHWDDAARGLICGLTRGSTARHLARAALEGIAYQVRDVFDAMQREAGGPLVSLLADGGATRSDALMQLQADILGRPVLRSTSPDVAALGAAFLAGLAVGQWTSEQELAGLPHQRDQFEPCLPQAAREAGYAGWRGAIARAMLPAGAAVAGTVAGVEPLAVGSP